MSAFSRHLVKSAHRQITPSACNHNRMNQRTLRLNLTAHPRVVILRRRSRWWCLRCRRSMRRPTEKHRRESVADGRADCDGTSGGCHLGDHAWARGASCCCSGGRGCGGVGSVGAVSSVSGGGGGGCATGGGSPGSGAGGAGLALLVGGT